MCILFQLPTALTVTGIQTTYSVLIFLKGFYMLSFWIWHVLFIYISLVVLLLLITNILCYFLLLPTSEACPSFF